MSLEEIEAAAAEAALSTALVRRAATQVTAPGQAPAPSNAFLGVPTQLVMERVIEGEFSSEDFDELLEVIPFANPGPGQASTIGKSLQWKGMSGGWQHDDAQLWAACTRCVARLTARRFAVPRLKSSPWLTNLRPLSKDSSPRRNRRQLYRQPTKLRCAPRVRSCRRTAIALADDLAAYEPRSKGHVQAARSHPLLARSNQKRVVHARAWSFRFPAFSTASWPPAET